MKWRMLQSWTVSFSLVFTCNGVYFHNYVACRRGVVFLKIFRTRGIEWFLKNVGLRKFCPDLEISKAFVIGLEVWFSGDFAFGVLNFETTKSQSYHTVPLAEQTQAQGRQNMSDVEGTPSFAHDCHSLYAPPPPSIVSLTFLYSDVVFLPSLT